VARTVDRGGTAMTTRHPLRLAVVLSLLAYLGGLLAVLWRRPAV